MSIPLSKRFTNRMSAVGALPKPAPAEATDSELVPRAKPARFSFKTSHHAKLPELDKPNDYMAELELHDSRH